MARLATATPVRSGRAVKEDREARAARDLMAGASAGSFATAGTPGAHVACRCISKTSPTSPVNFSAVVLVLLAIADFDRKVRETILSAPTRLLAATTASMKPLITDSWPGSGSWRAEV